MTIRSQKSRSPPNRSKAEWINARFHYMPGYIRLPWDTETALQPFHPIVQTNPAPAILQVPAVAPALVPNLNPPRIVPQRAPLLIQNLNPPRIVPLQPTRPTNIPQTQFIPPPPPPPKIPVITISPPKTPGALQVVTPGPSRDANLLTRSELQAVMDKHAQKLTNLQKGWINAQWRNWDGNQSKANVIIRRIRLKFPDNIPPANIMIAKPPPPPIPTPIPLPPPPIPLAPQLSAEEKARLLFTKNRPDMARSQRMDELPALGKRPSIPFGSAGGKITIVDPQIRQFLTRKDFEQLPIKLPTGPKRELEAPNIVPGENIFVRLLKEDPDLHDLIFDVVDADNRLLKASLSQSNLFLEDITDYMLPVYTDVIKINFPPLDFDSDPLENFYNFVIHTSPFRDDPTPLYFGTEFFIRAVNIIRLAEEFVHAGASDKETFKLSLKIHVVPGALSILAFYYLLKVHKQAAPKISYLKKLILILVILNSLLKPETTKIQLAVKHAILFFLLIAHLTPEQVTNKRIFDCVYLSRRDNVSVADMIGRYFPLIQSVVAKNISDKMYLIEQAVSEALVVLVRFKADTQPMRDTVQQNQVLETQVNVDIGIIEATQPAIQATTDIQATTSNRVLTAELDRALTSSKKALDEMDKNVDTLHENFEKAKEEANKKIIQPNVTDKEIKGIKKELEYKRKTMMKAQHEAMMVRKRYNNAQMGGDPKILPQIWNRAVNFSQNLGDLDKTNQIALFPRDKKTGALSRPTTTSIGRINKLIYFAREGLPELEFIVTMLLIARVWLDLSVEECRVIVSTKLLPRNPSEDWWSGVVKDKTKSLFLDSIMRVSETNFNYLRLGTIKRPQRFKKPQLAPVTSERGKYPFVRSQPEPTTEELHSRESWGHDPTQDVEEQKRLSKLLKIQARKQKKQPVITGTQSISRRQGSRFTGFTPGMSRQIVPIPLDAITEESEVTHVSAGSQIAPSSSLGSFDAANFDLGPPTISDQQVLQNIFDLIQSDLMKFDDSDA